MAQAASAKQFPFAWVGTDKKGKKVKGETIASTPAIVKAELRKMGLKPVKVAKKSTLFSARKQKIGPKDISIFMRQLATMLSAGVPLVQSFDIIGRGNDNPSVQDLLMNVKAEVESGSTLSASLAKHPLYFDELVCNLVNAGEQAGILEGLLDKIATYKEKTENMKAKIKKAMFYPVAVLIIAFIVTAILLIFVVPQFKEIFAGFGADLPAFTLFVIGISEWMQ
ncbi:MAG: type II secretion system F family protein, partial [Gammaproteobacteria bacterium]